LLRTTEAATPLSAGEISFSLTLFTAVYLFLFVVWLFLMIRKAKEEPV
jgi:cytochrome bd-type quinol oxidase subunit 1